MVDYNASSYIFPDLFKHTVENSYDGVFFVDKDRRITYWNRGAESITGYSLHDVIGNQCHDNFLMHVDGQSKLLCHTDCPFLKVFTTGRVCDFSAYIHHQKGHRLAVNARVIPIRDINSEISGAIQIFTLKPPEQQFAEQLEELKRLAFVDTFTEVANRRFIEMTLESKLSEFARYQNGFALLLLDADGFKNINDQYGHYGGDMVIKMIASTLKANVRPFDLVGRWGGDEFVCILTNIQSNSVTGVAERFRFLVEASSVSIKKQSVGVTVSMGGAYSRSNDTLNSIFTRADKMLYKSKEQGKNCFNFDA